MVGDEFRISYCLVVRLLIAFFFSFLAIFFVHFVHCHFALFLFAELLATTVPVEYSFFSFLPLLFLPLGFTIYLLRVALLVLSSCSLFLLFFTIFFVVLPLFRFLIFFLTK